MSIEFRAGNCLDVFGAEPDGSFDAFVCDWPAGVAFMSRSWDRDHGGREAWIKVWAEVARMMKRKAKPGAYALVWALPRTSHWTACALEDGGWFVQDVVTHVFGQGWPKGKAALKPASEHWILARNGSGGALQIDAARVARGADDVSGWSKTGSKASDNLSMSGANYDRDPKPDNPAGSWPPNFVLSHAPPTDGHPGCEERGTRRVSGSNGVRGKMSGNVYNSGLAVVGQDVGYASPDGTETVPAFDCLAACDCGLSVLAPAGGEPPRCACGATMWWACPVAEMDRQSGQSESTSHARGSGGFWGAASSERGVVGPSDSGGSSRFFPRFHQDRLFSCYEDAWQGKNQPGDTSANPKGDGTGNGESPAPGSCSNNSNTDGCGSANTDRSPTDSRSTTSITTTATTDWRTCNSSPSSGTTTTTPGSASTIGSSTAPSSEGASDAASGSRSTPTPCAGRAPITATAVCASPQTSASGRPRIESITSLTAQTVEPRDFPRSHYFSKAAGGERHAGCEGLYWRADKRSPFGFVRITREEWEGLPQDPDGKETLRTNRRDDQQPARVRGNVHPTVKSRALMMWLCSLVVPPGGRVGDVTCGSGGTGIAIAGLNAERDLGASFLGSDICPEAIEIAEARLAWWQANTSVQEGLFGERTIIAPEPKKPETPKPKRAARAEPPAVDPRQEAMFK